MTKEKHPYFTLTIRSIRKETSDTKTFVLDMGDRKFPYKAGQFLTLVFPNHINEGRRSYSISSSEFLHEPLSITVKRIDNGEFSRYLFDKCQVGDPLYTLGASGYFQLPEDVKEFKSYFFYAAGSGITPVFPLIKNLLTQYPFVSVKLVYSNHSIQTAIFYNEIRDLETKYSGSFTVEWLFSNNQDLMKARLTKVLVQRHVDEISNELKGRTIFYMCGPHDYMQMITITLLREGIDKQNIRKEIFDTVKPVVKEMPPDQEAHNIAVYYGGEQFTYQTQFPVTILEAAKKQGIILPYSCEAGKCGTCAATCVDGSVWMSSNEVLLDKELERGRVLTCTGYPVGGDVTLRFDSESK